MTKRGFEASHEVLASTPLGPIVEFSFRGEDDVSRGHKISAYLDNRLGEYQPSAVLLNFIDCRQFFDADMGSIIAAFIDRDREQSRPCAVLAKGRVARSVNTLLEVTMLARCFDVRVFEDRDSAVAYLHESISS